MVVWARWVLLRRRALVSARGHAHVGVLVEGLEGQDDAAQEAVPAQGLPVEDLCSA